MYMFFDFCLIVQREKLSTVAK